MFSASDQDDPDVIVTKEESTVSKSRSPKEVSEVCDRIGGGGTAAVASRLTRPDKSQRPNNRDLSPNLSSPVSSLVDLDSVSHISLIESDQERR